MHIEEFTIFTLCTCARDKVIGLYVCCRQHENHQIWRCERLVIITILLKSAKNWHQCVSNHLVQPMSVTNSPFMLAMPINHTHCRPCASCSYAQLAKHKQVKVVNGSHIDADAVCRVCALESSRFESFARCLVTCPLLLWEFTSPWYYIAINPF